MKISDFIWFFYRLLISKSADELKHASNFSLGPDFNDLLNSQLISDVVLQVQLITKAPHRLATVSFYFYIN